MKENIDYVVCLECGAKLQRINGWHLQSKKCSKKFKNVKEYRVLHKNSLTICFKSFEKKSQVQKGKKNPCWRHGNRTIEEEEKRRVEVAHRKKEKEFAETKPQQLCECGCGQITNPVMIFISGHNLRLNKDKTWEEIFGKEKSERIKKISSEKIKDWHKNPENQEKKKKMKKIRIKISNDWWKDPNNKEIQKIKAKKHSEKMKGRPSDKKGKSFEEMFGEKRAKKLRDKQRKNMLERLEKNPDKWHKLYIEAGKKGGFESVKSNIKNRPYIWNGVHFMSNLEMKVAKQILLTPIYGVNCHIKIDSKTIDFYPQEYDKLYQGKFVEYHPWDRLLTKDQYYKERKQIIEHSEYKGTELIVISDFEGEK